MSALKRRVDVFMEFLDSGRLDKVAVDAEQSEQLIKLLDAVVIRLEGGSELDLTILDEAPEVPKPTITISNEPEIKATVKIEPDEENEKSTSISEDKKEENDINKDTVKDIDNDGTSEKGDDEEIDDGIKKQVDEVNNSSDKEEESKDVTENDENDYKRETVKLKENGEEDEEDEKPTDLTNNDEDAMSMDEGESDEKKPEQNNENPIITVPSKEKDEGLNKEDNTPKPRPLHRTASIFLRNLAPTITKQEVEAMCKRYPGFMRVAIADPQPERRWFRRGWVTFQRDVNIKEICWNLNNIRLRDCELGAIVNRDLSRRIRTVTGLTLHKQVIRHDMKLSAKIIHNLDAKNDLWQDGLPNDQSFGLVSKNPVLRNITDYLIEEASAEEEELLGTTAEMEESDEKDQVMIKVLDRLLLYLRIVHSVDYYNHCEYPNEDEMPNRCGIMHARGSMPTSKVTSQEVQEYSRGFQQKISCLMNAGGPIVGSELTSLGAKDCESEVEKFVAANSQELAKDKWLCPLSGKKFKGPEFVRKHIFNKHGEKIEEVKKEVEYFNNYLRDPKRPQLPEHPGNRPAKKEPTPEHPMGPYFSYGGYGGGRGYQPPYGVGYGGYMGGYSRPGRGGFGRGGRGVSDYRPVIHYRDLDAPREPDEFI
uniref:Serrate RNA effector molecule homolog n=1 Tax=Clastoptera arizonana TaxID=38151 RepID=A0A1B6ECS8_9HEMI